MKAQSWNSISEILGNHHHLEREEIEWAMEEILSGRTPKEEVLRFLQGLNGIDARAEDVHILVQSMYRYSEPLNITERAVDIVGTGGDGFNTINISTTAAIVTTAAGARTIKHGNRAASSKSGAADLLEALGVRIDLKPIDVAECVRRIGIGFAYAPTFHPAMRHAAAARRELGVPTIFNILGPLANPAKPAAVAIGVANTTYFPIVAEVLALRGTEGFVMRGAEGLDEVSVCGPTQIKQIVDRKITDHVFHPRELGISLFPIEELQGGDAHFNADITRRVLQGEEGAPREAVLLNAAIAIAAFKRDFDLGINQQIANGYSLARQAIDSGKAHQLLERWANLTDELATASE